MPADPRFYAYADPVFAPAMRPILSITRANPMVVTTTFDGTTAGSNGYETGLIVRLLIPPGFGMEQADGLLAPITVISSSSFSMPIDSSSFDIFAIPAVNPGHYGTVAQVVPVGEVNEILSQAVQNVLPPVS